MRIALVLLGVAPLGGGGGAERYFADFAAAYARFPTRRHALTLLSDRPSLEALAEIGRIPETNTLQVLPNGRLAQIAALARVMRENLYDVVHLALPLPRHLPWMFASGTRSRRPRVAINVNDTRVAYPAAVRSGTALGGLERMVYACYFRCAPLDGLFTWYASFAERFRREHPRRGVHAHAARYCYVDSEAFRPAPRKEPWCVFSGRLIGLKRPLAFVEAVAAARRYDPSTIDAWRFLVYGRGTLEGEVLSAIERHGLGGVFRFNEGPPLAEALARASLYVSTQDLDNFSSLAMLEAMASGAAIVAPDVGRTSLFVRDGVNGTLVSADCGTLAETLLARLCDPDGLDEMGRASRQLAVTEFCFENACDELERFWETLPAHG